MTVPTIEELASAISVAIWGLDYKPREPGHIPDVRWEQALNAARTHEIQSLRETHAIATDTLDFIARARWAWRRQLVDAAASALKRIAELRALRAKDQANG